MNYLYGKFKTEIFKALHRKWQLTALLFTLVGFPLFMKAFAVIMAKASEQANEPPELFIAEVAGVHVKMTMFVLFIPLWTATFVGQEFSSNHVNKAVFLTSKKDYFISKIIYCFIVSLWFAAIESMSVAFSLDGGLFQSPLTKLSFIYWFAPHVFLINLFYALIFLCVTFAYRSPTASLLAAYCFPQLDGFAYHLFAKLFHINLNWLPFKLLNSTYIQNGYKYDANQYYNPLYEGELLIFLGPAALAVGLCFLSYRWFLVRDLKTMSD